MDITHANFFRNFLELLPSGFSKMVFPNIFDFLPYRRRIYNSSLSSANLDSNTKIYEMSFYISPSDPSNLSLKKLDSIIKNILSLDNQDLKIDINLIIDIFFRKDTVFDFPGVEIRFFFFRPISKNLGETVLKNFNEIKKKYNIELITLENYKSDPRHFPSIINSPEMIFIDCLHYTGLGLPFKELSKLNVLNFFIPKVYFITDIFYTENFSFFNYSEIDIECEE